MELQNQVKQTREALDEHVARLSKQVDTDCVIIHSQNLLAVTYLLCAL